MTYSYNSRYFFEYNGCYNGSGADNSMIDISVDKPSSITDCIHGYITKTMMYISIVKENLAKHAKTQSH